MNPSERPKRTVLWTSLFILACVAATVFFLYRNGPIHPESVSMEKRGLRPAELSRDRFLENFQKVRWQKA